MTSKTLQTRKWIPEEENYYFPLFIFPHNEKPRFFSYWRRAWNKWKSQLPGQGEMDTSDVMEYSFVPFCNGHSGSGEVVRGSQMITLRNLQHLNEKPCKTTLIVSFLLAPSKSDSKRSYKTFPLFCTQLAMRCLPSRKIHAPFFQILFHSDIQHFEMEINILISFTPRLTSQFALVSTTLELPFVLIHILERGRAMATGNGFLLSPGLESDISLSTIGMLLGSLCSLPVPAILGNNSNDFNSILVFPVLQG